MLDQKYQQMGRTAFLSPIDREGIVIWLLEYLRYAVNGCDHETAIANALIQITGRTEPPPICRKAPCTYQPSDHPRPSGAGGQFTVIMFRREGDCDWTASTTSTFIKLITTSGTYSGPLTFTVDQNSGSSRRGTILVEWDGGSTEVIVDQSGPSSQVSIQLFDFNKQTGETSECDSRAGVTLHSAPSRHRPSFPKGSPSYTWSAVYNYGGTTKTPSHTGTRHVCRD